MCGLIAVLLADPDARACQLLYDGLTMLQHRGQDAAGMVTCDATAGTLHMRKSTGLVKEVFQVSESNRYLDICKKISPIHVGQTPLPPSLQHGAVTVLTKKSCT